MKRPPVRLRASAIQDLKDIYDWIVSESGYLQVAVNFVDRILDRCESLSTFSMIGRARDDLQPGVRILPFERIAVIAYRIHAGKVEVINIFYGGRDYEALLRDEDGLRPPPRV